MAKAKNKSLVQAQITRTQQAKAVIAKANLERAHAARLMSATSVFQANGLVGMSSNARWQLLAAIVIFSVLIYHLAPILTPFATAALFAYLGDPAADRLEARGFSRTFSVVLVFLAMLLTVTAVLLVLIPMIEAQVSKLIDKLPSYLEILRLRLLPWLNQRFGVSTDLLDVDKIVGLLRAHWQSAGGVATTILATVGKSGLALLGWVVNLTLIPVLLFYFLRDWDRMIERIHELLPRHLEPAISELARQSDDVCRARFGAVDWHGCWFSQLYPLFGRHCWRRRRLTGCLYAVSRLAAPTRGVSGVYGGPKPRRHGADTMACGR